MFPLPDWPHPSHCEPPAPPRLLAHRTRKGRRPTSPESSLLELLLRSQLVGVAALALAAVGSTRRETSLKQGLVGGDVRYEVPRITYVALAANHLFAVELGGQGLQGGLDQTTTQTEDQVESRLLQLDCQSHVPAEPKKDATTSCSQCQVFVSQRRIQCVRGACRVLLTFWML